VANRWEQLKNHHIQDGDSVLNILGLGTAKYSDLTKKLAIISGVYYLMI